MVPAKVGASTATRPVTVTSNGKTIHQILRAGTYRVPRFQRPYSWDRAVVEDFWQDVTESRLGYFIGSMVVYTESDDLYGLVDGQQRLTTITILLAAIRNELRALSEDDAAKGVHTLIERKDLTNKDRFVLEAETSYPYLQGQIQSLPGAVDAVVAAGVEEKTLQQAFTFLSTRVRGLVARGARADKVVRLIDLRDRVLGLTVVLVEVEDEDDATVIFQTMNSRGKDLETADLIKSHIFGELKANNKSFDAARDRWNGILQLFNESAADLSMNRFLLHSWLSRHDYVGEKGLFKAVRSYARGSAVAGTYLDELVADAELYRTAQEPAYRKWTRTERELRDSLEALMLFRLRQPLPMLLALLRDLDSKTLKPRMVLRGLRIIENFHFAYTAVASQPSSGGVSGMYARSARELLAARTPQAKANVLIELENKLRQRLPSYAEFEASFLELRSSRVYTQQTPLVRYVLRRLHVAACARGVNPEELDLDVLTIEHLVPQGAKRPSAVSNGDVARLGNLLLVTSDLNEALADKSFATKQQILRVDRANVDAEIVNASQWGSTEIVERTKKLAKRAYEEVWSL
jgi:hypothetical protein